MPWQPLDDETPMFTYAMMAVFIAVFGAQATHANLAMLYSFPWRVANGEIWRLVTATTMHGSLLHFVFNMAMFLRFSIAIERWLGPWITMAMYILFALGSGSAEILWSAGLAIGASGVVYGYFGFLWVVRRRYDVAAEVTPPSTIQVMLGWLAICAVINLMGGHIANAAHLWGLLMGWLLGHVVLAHRVQKAWIGMALAAALALPLGMTYGPIAEQTWARVPMKGWLYVYRASVDPQEWAEGERQLAERSPLRSL